MPALRKSLKRPQTWLALLLLLVLLTGIDSCRKPSDQFTARFYISAVHLYQCHISPHLNDYIECRYRPTCSEYSVEAVHRFGIAHGLYLTIRRVWSCRSNVPLGTYDPVPAR